ncbi:MAG: TRAP transporter substrate-binding protein [candidate division NC10 bacterium]
MKRGMVLMLVVGLALAGTVGIAQAQQKFTAKIADILAPDHPHALTMKFFADKVKERTKGRMEIQVFPAAQLGQTKDLFMGVQAGSIEMAKMPMSFSGEWIPESKVWDLPYLFSSREGLWKAIRSNVGKKFMSEYYPRLGLAGLFWVDDGGRSIYANKAIRKPEDLQGMKIRVQPSDIQIDAINKMGGIGTPLAFGEVYLAIQQKVLDGAENSPALVWNSKHWEVAKVYSLTEQFWSVSAFIANKKWWDGLPKDIQSEMMAAVPETEKYFTDTYIALESKAIGLLKEKGVTVVTDVDKATFEKRIQPVYENFVKKYPFGKDLLDQIRAAMK